MVVADESAVPITFASANCGVIPVLIVPPVVVVVPLIEVGPVNPSSWSSKRMSSSSCVESKCAEMRFFFAGVRLSRSLSSGRRSEWGLSMSCGGGGKFEELSLSD